MGPQATSLVNLQLFSGPAISLGLDAQLLTRTDGKDDFGQFRLRGLIGVSEQPQPSDSLLGYELFVAPSLARIYVAEHRPAELRGGIGLQGGLPLRLSPHKPSWRSDDLVGLGTYLVPWVAGAWYYENSWDLSAGLMFRFSLWSAVLP